MFTAEESLKQGRCAQAWAGVARAQRAAPWAGKGSRGSPGARGQEEGAVGEPWGLCAGLCTGHRTRPVHVSLRGGCWSSQYPALLSSAGPSHRKPEGQGPPMHATQICLTGRRARGKEGKTLEPLPLYR